MASTMELNPANLDVEQGNDLQVKSTTRPTSAMAQPDEFSVTWKNLTYAVDKKPSLMSYFKTASFSTKKITILNSLNGQFKSGELTALVGPSGAGKSTLLESIASIRVKGRFGEVTFSGKKKVNMAFIPQKDHFYDLLTVREALIFASKFQNTATSEDDEGYDNLTTVDMDSNFHKKLVDDIIGQLGLQVCADVRIGGCSGGQLKRLSIAQELVSRPHILILDEPTSGLDSSSCYQVVELLYKLTQGQTPMAIVATIHQPSAKVFNLFHKVYALAVGGLCIYEGSPRSLLDYLKKFSLEIPVFTNPADFLIEIASGEKGRKYIASMALHHEKEARDTTLASAIVLAKSIPFMEKDLDDMIVTMNYPFFQHVMYHFKRSSLVGIRDPMLFYFRVFSHLFVGVFIGLMYGDRNIGGAGGCPPSLGEASDPSKFEQVQQKMEDEVDAVYNNLGQWFFACIFLQFGSLLPTVLTFPMEMSVFAKERTNGWYSVLTYYIGKSLADIPFQLICPLTYLAITYLMTGQPLEWMRFVSSAVPMVMMTFVAQSHGLLVGALFSDDILSAVYVAPSTCVPLMLFTGFFIKIEYLPYYLRPGIYLSYVRYAFEAVIIALYGHDRCGGNPVETVTIMRQKLTMFLSNVFRIALAPDDEDEDDVSGGDDGAKNLTRSMVTGIVKQLSGKVEMVDGKEVVGVLAQFRVAEDEYSHDLQVILIFFLIIRVYTFFVVRYRGTTAK